MSVQSCSQNNKPHFLLQSLHLINTTFFLRCTHSQSPFSLGQALAAGDAVKRVVHAVVLKKGVLTFTFLFIYLLLMLWLVSHNHSSTNSDMETCRTSYLHQCNTILCSCRFNTTNPRRADLFHFFQTYSEFLRPLIAFAALLQYFSTFEACYGGDGVRAWTRHVYFFHS